MDEQVQGSGGIAPTLGRSLAPKPKYCFDCGCPLAERGTGFVPAFPQTGSFPLLIVGEAPGEMEALSSIPFVGPSGKFLERIASRTPLDLSQAAKHNVLSCRPPDNKLRDMPWKEGAVQSCGRFLERTIDRVRPRAILALGDTALERLTGKSGIQRHRGYVLIGPRNIPVVATFHPAYLLPGRTKDEVRSDRPARYTGAVLWDMNLAWKLATDPEPFFRTPIDYRLDPDPFTFKAMASDFRYQVELGKIELYTADIETPGKNDVRKQDRLPMLDQPITRISFAWEPGKAISIPWDMAYFEGIRLIFESKAELWGFNSWCFDGPILEKQFPGFRLGGVHHDIMRAWHVLESDLPKVLEFVTSFFAPDLFPWKHLKGPEPALYSATDSDAQIRDAIGIRAILKRNLKLWDIYDRLVRQVHQEALIPAGRRGLLIDLEKQKALQTRLENEFKALLIEVQGLVPETFYNEKFFVRPPKNVPYREEIQEVEIKACSCGKLKPTVLHYRGTKKTAPCSGIVETIKIQAPRYRRLMDLSQEKNLADIREEIELAGYNPLSLAHLARVLEANRHLQLLDNRYSTLDDTTLEALEKRFGKSEPLYERIRKAREFNKKLGTYVYGYAPDVSGRIYTTYNDNPSTLRFGSSDVNTQNVKGDIKETIVPPPGWRIIECDSSAIEAVLTGYAARDPEHIRMASRGIHDYLVCAELGIPFDQDGKRISREEYGSTKRKQKKITVYLSLYGGQPRKMWIENPEVYKDELEAAREQSFYLNQFPRIKKWQTDTRLLVSRTNVLVNDWGFPQRFFAVFDGKGPGPDYNRCLAAGPQSLAAFIMRETLWEISQTDWCGFLWANATTHDSIALIVPESLAEDGMDYLVELMGRPIRQLDNLRIGCECKIDQGNWGNMRVVKAWAPDDPLELSRWHLSTTSSNSFAQPLPAIS